MIEKYKALRGGLLQYHSAIVIGIVFFYFVGLIGMLLPSVQAKFFTLTPVALLFGAVLVLLFHRGDRNWRTVYVFSLIAVLGFGVEVAGVTTHLIFGNYYYGNGLGVKLFETPLIIGLNWALLVYFTASIVHKLKVSVLLKILVASCLMLVYDIIMEQVAPHIDMWHWQWGVIPLQNYVAWFVIALFFQTLVFLSKLTFKNAISLSLFVCQLVFFLLLYISFHFIA